MYNKNILSKLDVYIENLKISKYILKSICKRLVNLNLFVSFDNKSYFKSIGIGVIFIGYFATGLIEDLLLCFSRHCHTICT